MNDDGARSATHSVDAARLHDSDRLYASLAPLPAPGSSPVLIVLTGLPGAGKSHFCRELARLLPSLITLETDSLRFTLFDAPTHSEHENARIYGAIHRVIARLLQGGHTVAADATNLRRRNRRRLYRIADAANARVIVVALAAPEDVIRQRLSRREEAMAMSGRADDNSTAGNEVYDRMSLTAQPVRRSHVRVDSSRDITPALMDVVATVRQDALPQHVKPL